MMVIGDNGKLVEAKIERTPSQSQLNQESEESGEEDHLARFYRKNQAAHIEGTKRFPKKICGNKMRRYLKHSDKLNDDKLSSFANNVFDY